MQAHIPNRKIINVKDIAMSMFAFSKCVANNHIVPGLPFMILPKKLNDKMHWWKVGTLLGYKYTLRKQTQLNKRPK
jgi:hypothetical protein